MLIFIIVLITIVTLLLIILKQRKMMLQPKKILAPSKPAIVVTSRDIRAIAGEDLMATKLDLARAYIELNKKNIAKQILSHVMAHGDETERSAAEQLMLYLE